jgi:predicted house-cleaning noncanonical NTP pyrophosphatase (MazG superfamily)
MPVYNKLVRDRIPEIIEQTGKTYKVRQLSTKEFQRALSEKLIEEMNEYKAAKTDEESLEELADVLEVIYSLASLHGSSPVQLETLRKQKVEKRGGFEKGLFLIEVEDAEG